MNLTTNTNTFTLLFQIIPPAYSTNTSPRSLFFSLQHHKSLCFHVRRLPSSKQTMPPPETFQDEFDDEEIEDEDGDVFVPLSNMRQWTRNKPRGFGEGKVYDTSLEDKLLDHSRAAQLLNVNNLLKNPPNHIPNHKPEPSGLIRVRLLNLPKKKNIHRDLQAAFKPPFTTGITNIIPAVSGNQNTRDPLCKGFAFVHFNSHKDANRFVDIFSKQPITFGKVQKQIKCEIMEPLKPSAERIQSPLPVLSATMETPLDPCVEHAIGDDADLYNVAEAGSESLKKHKAVREKGKKTTRAKNTPKQNIPGSANRLKMKEKALLSGVFSKYGAKSSD